MNISVNVPSWHRSNQVLTFKYLPFVRVWVDDEEYEEYKKNYPDKDIVRCRKGVQGNVSRVRNYILDEEFKRGMDVVVIVDDDLQGLYRFVMKDGFLYNREKVETDEFVEFVEHYSVMAQDIGAKFWGVNINDDKFAYRADTPFNTAAYIGGPFQAFLKGNRCRYDEELPLKEDYDMTLQQLNKERVVLRVNSHHYLCKQSENKGGCATMRNRDKEEQQFRALQEKWGG